MEPNFLGSPHHHGAIPKLFFQPTVKALKATVRSLYRAFSWRARGMTSRPRKFRLMMGDMPQAAAQEVNPFAVLARIYQIIQVIHPVAGQLHQGNGHLTVVHGGRGQRQADR